MKETGYKENKTGLFVRSVHIFFGGGVRGWINKLLNKVVKHGTAPIYVTIKSNLGRGAFV